MFIFLSTRVYQLDWIMELCVAIFKNISEAYRIRICPNLTKSLIPNHSKSFQISLILIPNHSKSFRISLEISESLFLIVQNSFVSLFETPKILSQAFIISLNLFKCLWFRFFSNISIYDSFQASLYVFQFIGKMKMVFFQW